MRCSIEACASTCSHHPPPRFAVNPSVRPVLTTPLSRLRHNDVHPRAQFVHNGAIPRGRHGMHGSIATRVHTGYGQSIPASVTRPMISWPRTKGMEPIESSVGDGVEL